MKHLSKGEKISENDLIEYCAAMTITMLLHIFTYEQKQPEESIMNTRNLLALFSVLMMLIFTGCATTGMALPKMDEMSGIKGQTAESIARQYGEPARKYTDSNGNQVWEYKQPAASQRSANTFMAIGSFGFASGSNSFYVDIMRLTFSHGVVVNYAIEENTMNISLPGGTQTPTAMPVEYKRQEVTPKVMHPIQHKTTSEKKVTHEHEINFSSFVKTSKRFSNRSLAEATGNISSGSKSKGMKIIRKTKTNIVIMTTEGAKINVNLRQIKKDLNVEIHATGNFGTGVIFQDFSDIYSFI